MGAYSNLGDLSTAQVISGAAHSEFYIDMANVKPRLGIGQHAPFLCIRMVTTSTDTADSLSIELWVAATISGDELENPVSAGMVLAGITNASGVNEVIATDSRISKAGAWIFQGQLPYGCNLRYLALYYNNTISGNQFVIDAWLNDGPASIFRGSQKIYSNVGTP